MRHATSATMVRPLTRCLFFLFLGFFGAGDFVWGGGGRRSSSSQLFPSLGDSWEDMGKLKPEI